MDHVFVETAVYKYIVQLITEKLHIIPLHRTKTCVLDEPSIQLIADYATDEKYYPTAGLSVPEYTKKYVRCRFHKCFSDKETCLRGYKCPFLHDRESTIMQAALDEIQEVIWENYQSDTFSERFGKFHHASRELLKDSELVESELTGNETSQQKEKREEDMFYQQNQPFFDVRHGIKSIPPDPLNEFHLPFREAGVYIKFNLINCKFRMFRALYQPNEARDHTLPRSTKGIEYALKSEIGPNDPDDDPECPLPLYEVKLTLEKFTPLIVELCNIIVLYYDQTPTPPPTKVDNNYDTNCGVNFHFWPQSSDNGIPRYKPYENSKRAPRSPLHRTCNYYQPLWSDLGVPIANRPIEKPIDQELPNYVCFDPLDFAHSLMQVDVPVLYSYRTCCQEINGRLPMRGLPLQKNHIGGLYTRHTKEQWRSTAHALILKHQFDYHAKLNQARQRKQKVTTAQERMNATKEFLELKRNGPDRNPYLELLEENLQIAYAGGFRGYGHWNHMSMGADNPLLNVVLPPNNKFQTKNKKIHTFGDPYQPVVLYDYERYEHGEPHARPHPYVYVPFHIDPKTRKGKPMTQSLWKEYFHQKLHLLWPSFPMNVTDIIAEYVLMLQWEIHYDRWKCAATQLVRKMNKEQLEWEQKHGKLSQKEYEEMQSCINSL